MSTEKRKYFCPVPWVHLSSRPNGDYQACCRVQKIKIHDDSGKVSRWYNTSINSVWNSKYFRDFRSRILDDRPSEECSYCYQDEAHGNISLRQKKIIQFEELIPKILKDSSLDAELPVELDLKLSNICNLSCAMCWPTSSHLVARDIQKILETDFFDDRLSDDLSTSLKIKKGWDSDPSFAENVFYAIDNISYLQFTGGEPFLNKVFFQTLKYCVEKNLAKNIHLFITTNLSLLDTEDISLFKNFKKVSLHLSVDGVGSQFEYIRSPLRWASWTKKFLMVLDEDIDYKFFFTLSTYSIFGLVDFLKWASSYDPNLLNTVLIKLYEPTFLNISNLPEGAKNDLKEELEKFFAENPQSRSILTPVLKDLYSAITCQNQINKCQKYTLSRDKIKGEFVGNFIPKFAHYYELC